MSAADGNPFTWPAEVGGYEILSTLPEGESALALAAGGRRVVLKRLDPDCLLRSDANPKLHATIRDRLARVRELAHARVANLYGVEHDRGIVYLVWEYVEGRPLEDWAIGEQRRPSQRELLLASRELILTVEALHARGIVHGAIHGRNVIVDPQGKLKLTHVSPLLYSEPRHDIDSIADLFGHIAQQRGEAESPLDRLAHEVHYEPDATLRSMGARASSLIDLRRDEASEEQERRGDARRRRRSRLAAALVLMAALGLSWEIRQSVRRLTPPPPSPPQAPPAAME